MIEFTETARIPVARVAFLAAVRGEKHLRKRAEISLLAYTEAIVLRKRRYAAAFPLRTPKALHKFNLRKQCKSALSHWINISLKL